MRARFKFSYGPHPGQTVSVVSQYPGTAEAAEKAQAAIHARYAKTAKPLQAGTVMPLVLLSVAKLPIGARKW